MSGRSASAEILALDHYLEVLARKPGALPGATALAQTPGGRDVHRRPPGVLGRRPLSVRRRRRDRALTGVLLAHRTLPAGALAAAMAEATASGALARYDRPAPALDAYDQLLARTIP